MERPDESTSFMVGDRVDMAVAETSVSEAFAVILTLVSQELSIRYWGVPRERYRRERCHPNRIG